jgi:hypothetical protein
MTPLSELKLGQTSASISTLEEEINSKDLPGVAHGFDVKRRDPSLPLRMTS